MIYKDGEKVQVTSKNRCIRFEGEVLGESRNKEGDLTKLIVKDISGVINTESYPYSSAIISLSKFDVYRLDGIARGRGADDYLGHFLSSGNNMDDMSGKEFYAKFRDFCEEYGIELRDMVEWAIDFNSFLVDNPTYDACPEQILLLNKFLKYA